MTLLDEALSYASIGMPVFPCVPGGKEPLTPTGFYGASCNPQKIRAWWSQYPDANIGTPTGHIGSKYFTIDVMDIDRRPEGDGFDLYRQIKEAGLVSNCWAVVETPSGGMHCYFKGSTNPGGSLRGKYVDYKAVGGYVLLPPSMVKGRVYQLAWRLPKEDIKSRDSQVNWQAILEKYGPTTIDYEGKEGNAEYQMEYLAAYLRKQRTGNRNNALHWATCRAIEAGYNKSEFDPIINAALEIGLEPAEIAATMNSAKRNVGAQRVYRTRAG